MSANNTTNTMRPDRICVCGGLESKHCPQLSGCEEFIPVSPSIGITRSKKTRGFFQTDNDIVRVYMQRIGVYGFAVYSVLQCHARNDSQTTFIGQEKIGEFVGCSRSTVQRELANLVGHGLVRQISRKEAGLQNLYELLDPSEWKTPNRTPGGASGERHPGAPMTKTAAGGGCLNDTAGGASMTNSYMEEQDVSTNKTSSGVLFEQPRPSRGGDLPSLVLVGHKPKPIKDARFTPCVDACKAYADAKGVTFQWGPAEGKQLKELLATAATLTVDGFRKCLQNRARSAVAHGEPPRVWLPTLLKYQDGPLDRFGKPEGSEYGANQRIDAGRFGSSPSRGERVTNSNIAAAQRVYESVVDGVA